MMGAGMGKSKSDQNCTLDAILNASTMSPFRQLQKFAYCNTPLGECSRSLETEEDITCKVVASQGGPSRVVVHCALS